ncbi:hypothetical protein BC355_09015 [Vibrio cholerae]|uniref:Uncharacterized protein n=1 Tax=Vibrio cholerae TaxID=666 RepID=A0A395TZ11_VIBCL|nr:hypothetical protein [Vibrio cholerae]MBC9069518.1 hypothetical protein [Vibrio cholerae]RGP89850.1 hypothetical protein BC353_09825 [Vibrio cholerae]RGP90034.1 hypothetical protein BC355_09015 [Vibrio cholerae]RGP90757.1 hypothetical protein BC354_08210 [Vibrio cholerae]
MKNHQYKLKDFKKAIAISIAFILISLVTSSREYLLVTGIVLFIVFLTICERNLVLKNIDKYWNIEFIIDQYKLTPSSTTIIYESFEGYTFQRLFKTPNGRYGIFKLRLESLAFQSLICHVKLIDEEEAKKALLKAGKDMYVKEFGDFEEA